MFRVKGSIAPAIAVIGGVTYILPHWKEVPEGTTLADVKWIRPKTKKIERPEEMAREIRSSRGDKMYLVIARSDGTKECSCAGFMYRRRCSHSDDLLKEMGWNK